MSRRRVRRGPPFVEIGGHLYLNLAFDLRPLGPDVRERIAGMLGKNVAAKELMLLRLLTAAEAKMVRRRRREFDDEVWALLTGPGSERQRW